MDVCVSIATTPIWLRVLTVLPLSGYSSILKHGRGVGLFLAAANAPPPEMWAETEGRGAEGGGGVLGLFCCTGIGPQRDDDRSDCVGWSKLFCCH